MYCEKCGEHMKLLKKFENGEKKWICPLCNHIEWTEEDIWD